MILQHRWELAYDAKKTKELELLLVIIASVNIRIVILTLLYVGLRYNTQF
jgi:hypothetical protein